MSQRHRDTAAATVNTLYGTFASPFPFDLSPVNSPDYLPSLSDPTRSLGIVIREHFRHHRAVQWEREKELRAAPEYVERPLCPAPLLPFCSFIAILHAQSADLADYADYGKYTQTQTSTHTHTHTHSFSIEAQHSPGHVHAIPLAVTTHFFGNITLSLFAKLDQL